MAPKKKGKGSKKPIGYGIPTAAKIKSMAVPSRYGKSDHIDMAFDLSSSCVGWCVFLNETPITHGKFVFRKKALVADKLIVFMEFLPALFETFSPDRIILEKPPTSNGNTTFRHIELLSVVRIVAKQVLGIDIPDAWLLPAIQIKRILGLKRMRSHDLNKKLMVDFVNDKYNLKLTYDKDDKDVSGDDIADAYGVLTAFYRK